jgi:gas vesicle protein
VEQKQKQVVNQVKKIQSHLSRDNIKLSLGEVRKAIAQFHGFFDEDMELTDEICDRVIEGIKANQPAPLARTSEEVAAPLANRDSSGLSEADKNKVINSVAQEIDVSLPIEALRDIAKSVDWALSSRLELMQELRTQIQAWANHKRQEVEKISKDIRNETNQLFADVSSNIQDAIEQDNQSFLTQAEAMKAQINNSVEKFRNSSKEILNVFSISA